MASLRRATRLQWKVQVNIEIAFASNYVSLLRKILSNILGSHRHPPCRRHRRRRCHCTPPKLPEVTPPNLARGKSMVQELLSLSAYFHFS